MDEVVGSVAANVERGGEDCCGVMGLLWIERRRCRGPGHVGSKMNSGKEGWWLVMR